MTTFQPGDRVRVDPMSELDLAAIRARAEAATRGPWTWDGHRVPTLEGREGSPETYEYAAGVIEADHYGECGCRSVCTLVLDVSAEDAAHIAGMDPTTTKALLDRLEAALTAIERMRIVIENEQHADRCGSRLSARNRCSCWKEEASFALDGEASDEQ